MAYEVLSIRKHPTAGFSRSARENYFRWCSCV